MFMIFTKSTEDTIPSPPPTHCVPAFNPNIATLSWLKGAWIVLTELITGPGFVSISPDRLDFNNYPVIHIFINIWYWIRPPCIRLLWLLTFYYMWILVLHFQYPVFVRLSIFSPYCRRGIFRCSLILASDSMCIYFFTSFICKKMHSGRLWSAFSDVGSK